MSARSKRNGKTPKQGQNNPVARAGQQLGGYSSPGLVAQSPNMAGSSVRTVHSQVEIRQEGPLPTPQDFAGYDAVMPGAAKRIIVMAEEEQKHRHALQTTGMNAAALDQPAYRLQVKRQQWMGCFLVVLLIGFAGFALVKDAPAVAITTIGTTVTGIAAIFVLGRVLNTKDEAAKAQKPDSKAPDKPK